jgi:hypothetical protein
MDMRHFNYYFHLFELWARFLVILGADVATCIGDMDRTREPCDAPRPSRNSLIYFWHRFQHLKVLDNGRCVARQAKTDAVVERLTHQPCQNCKDCVAQRIWICRIRKVGNCPVRMISAEVLKFISKLYVPVNDEKFIETVERGGCGVGLERASKTCEERRVKAGGTCKERWATSGGTPFVWVCYWVTMADCAWID